MGAWTPTLHILVSRTESASLRTSFSVEMSTSAPKTYRGEQGEVAWPLGAVKDIDSSSPSTGLMFLKLTALNLESFQRPSSKKLKRCCVLALNNEGLPSGVAGGGGRVKDKAKFGGSANGQ